MASKIKFKIYTPSSYKISTPDNICLLGEFYNYYYWGKDFHYITSPLSKNSKRITILEIDTKTKKSRFFKSFKESLQND